MGQPSVLVQMQGRLTQSGQIKSMTRLALRTIVGVIQLRPGKIITRLPKLRLSVCLSKLALRHSGGLLLRAYLWRPSEMSLPPGLDTHHIQRFAGSGAPKLPRRHSCHRERYCPTGSLSIEIKAFTLAPVDATRAVARLPSCLRHRRPPLAARRQGGFSTRRGAGFIAQFA